jgi:succinate-acetate transporter protein
LPLGFLALSIATFAFAAIQVGWIDQSQARPVALAVLFSTVPLQALVSAFAFAARDAAAGTAMGLLSGAWAAVSVVTLTSRPGATSDGLGVVLLAAGACLLVPAAAALPRTLPPLVIGLSAVRFGVTGAAQLEGGTAWLRTAGWIGMCLAVVSLVAALVLAVRRSTAGGDAPLSEEPGVRPGV